MTEFNKLSALHAACFPEKPWTADDFAELKGSGAKIIMSDNSFLVYRLAADEIEILTIGVRPDARRTLTATALLKVMENEVKKSGARAIFLEVAADNDAAISMYEKNGYARMGTRPGYYDGIDAITMKKELI